MKKEEIKLKLSSLLFSFYNSKKKVFFTKSYFLSTTKPLQIVFPMSIAMHCQVRKFGLLRKLFYSGKLAEFVKLRSFKYTKSELN